MTSRRQLQLLTACAIAVYAGIIWLVNNGTLPPAVGVFLAIPAVLGLCELAFRIIDGPYPAVPAADTERRKLYPWMAGAAAAVPLIGLYSGFAAFMVGLPAAVGLWFLYHKARRYDYGRAAVCVNYWVHWQYTAADLDAFDGLDPKATPETYLGPDGLLFVGTYAPWALSFHKLTRAGVTLDAPPRLDLAFRRLGFGDAVADDVFHVPIPAGGERDLARIERELRARCPRAAIDFS